MEKEQRSLEAHAQGEIREEKEAVAAHRKFHACAWRIRGSRDKGRKWRYQERRQAEEDPQSLTLIPKFGVPALPVPSWI